MATKASPPVAVAAANMFSDLSVPHIVNLLTLVYLALMISHKAWTMYREYKATTNDRRGKPRPKKEVP